MDNSALLSSPQLGIVVIGRNEGARLRRCLNSVAGQGAPMVYVDSGSTDDSLQTARAFEVAVVALDPGLPFTAARGRNAGFEYLLSSHPTLRYVQFVDGDCALVDGWLQAAQQTLEADPGLAVASGRRRERRPATSVYHRMMDMNLRNTVPGEAPTYGGDALVRVAAFAQVGGFNPALLGGEEAELSARLRERGWKIWQSDGPMTVHETAPMRFGQWWRRSERTGWAFAAGAWLHGHGPDPHSLRHTRSILLWAGLLPLLALGALRPTRGKSAVLLLGYPALALRVFGHMRRRGFAPGEAALYAVFCVLDKFPQLMGLLRFHRARLAAPKAWTIDRLPQQNGGVE